MNHRLTSSRREIPSLRRSSLRPIASRGRTLFTVIVLAVIGLGLRTRLPAQPAQDLQREMQQKLTESQQDIAKAQQALAAAIANKEGPSVIAAWRNKISVLEQQRTLFQELVGGLANLTPPAGREAPETSSGEVPAIDARRIGALPRDQLTDAQLVTFLERVRAGVERALPTPERRDAQSLYREVRAKWSAPTALANIASTCWMNGHPETALFLMGIAVTAEPANGNNLNSYAAFLSMAGAEHAAVPILDVLNARFPNNSTVLNNLGQAWFGLGDMTKAKRYLNLAVAAYRTHSQANQTLARIHKSEANVSEAVQAIKRALGENFTAEKEAALTDLGATLGYDDVPFPYPLPSEPLGLDKFITLIPDYPMSAAEEPVKTAEWNGFKSAVAAKAEVEFAKIQDLKREAEAFEQRLHNRTAQPTILQPYNNSVVATAMRRKQLLLIASTNQGLQAEARRKPALEQIKQLRSAYEAAARTSDDCALKTAFLAEANTIWHDLNFEEVRHAKQRMVELIGLELYTSLDRSLLAKTVAHERWLFLNLLGSLRYERGRDCVAVTSVVGPRRKQLPDFDEVNCAYKSEVFIPPFTTISIECNRLVTEFDVDSELGPSAKLRIEENLATGKYTKCNLEIGVAKEIGGAALGPVKAEASAGGSLGVEVTSDGVKQVYARAGITAAVGADAPEGVEGKSISAAGAQATVSWTAGARGEGGNLGTSLAGQGALRDLNLAGP